VSQKMQTRALRNLERNGLVERQVYPIIPPKVEYALTPLGETLIALLLTMNTWAGEHLQELEQARARYDQAASA
jgi:DNA-binding HxlR family transcriptional regulator